MPIGLIGAGVAAAGAVGGALISSNAVNNATNASTNAANANNALQSQIYQSNKGLIQPYVTSGDNAETALNGFLGLGGNPQATQTAFNNYLNSTGYQFALNQGLNSVTQSQAASGMLGSGATLKALDAYGTNEAQQYGQQYVGNLQNEVGTGTNAVNALTGAGTNYANQVSANNNSAATASGNAALAGATITSNAINGVTKAIGSGFGASSFAPSTSGSSNANAFSGSWVPGG